MVTEKKQEIGFSSGRNAGPYRDSHHRVADIRLSSDRADRRRTQSRVPVRYVVHPGRLHLLRPVRLLQTGHARNE